MMRRLSLVVVAVLMATVLHEVVPHAYLGEAGHDHALPQTASAQSDPACSEVPLGALPPARPTWCSPTSSGPATFTQGTNTWLDEFDHGLSNASLGEGYRVFDSQLGARTQHFRHNNHWMMDLEPRPQEMPTGGGMMRPDRPFRFENGRLVVETDVAAGIASYGNGADIWPEVVVTTAPGPTGRIPDSLYAYGQFGGHWSFGCRYQPTRVPVCALYNPDGRPGDPRYFGTDDGRVFEMSHFQHIGTQVYGGEPGPRGGERDRAWRTCANEDPDTTCRDRFRLELTKTSVTLFVNGVRYFEQTGLQVAFPDALVNGDVYIYQANWQARQTVPTIRFHWDRLAVNPGTGPSPAPSFGSVPPPASTPTPTSPAATSTAVPATQTPAPVPSTPTPTSPAAPAQPSFTTWASVTPSTVAKGETVTLAASVTSATAMSALVDVEVYDRSGVKVYQRFYDNQAFAAGQTKTYRPTWTVPATAATGTYTVKIGVFIPGWGTLYAWNDAAAEFSVSP